MLCSRPYMRGIMPCRCMKCPACRIFRRKVWTNRLILESTQHDASSFATLTYDSVNLPKDGSLQIRDYQTFLKRLRKAIYPQKIRYFLAGEYGAVSGRPHYHLILFGLDRFVAGGMDSVSGVVNSSWRLGFTQVGSVTPSSCAYVCGYVTKKYRRMDYGLKQPEFFRMSLRPSGIGASATFDIAKTLNSGFGRLLVSQLGDVPSALKRGMSYMQLGRYVRGKLREAVGLGGPESPPGAEEKYYRELRGLCEAYEKNSKNASKSWRQIVLDMDKYKLNNLVAREAILGQKGRL